VDERARGCSVFGSRRFAPGCQRAVESGKAGKAPRGIYPVCIGPGRRYCGMGSHRGRWCRWGGGGGGGVTGVRMAPGSRASVERRLSLRVRGSASTIVKEPRSSGATGTALHCDCRSTCPRGRGRAASEETRGAVALERWLCTEGGVRRLPTRGGRLAEDGR
jgi:hypothetical protein